MSEFKRQWTTSIDSSENQLKKFRTTSEHRVTCFEDLSNELYLDIFEYIEGFGLYEAFSNLNTRFENLLVDPSIRLKINPHWLFTNVQDRLINLVNATRDRIISLRLICLTLNAETLSRFTINSSFNRLESLHLGEINSNQCIPLLVSILTLPRLFLLQFSLEDEPEEIGNIYQIILNMPMLTYSNISFDTYDTTIPLPMRINEQFSGIEHLVMNHPCSLNELINILSYTPQLRRLVCEKLDEANVFLPGRDPIQMLYLTHLTFTKCFIDFDELEAFMNKISPPLELFCLACARDSSYLNADRWENIISKTLPQLRTFTFKYEEPIDGDLEMTAFHGMILRFYSTFWIKRKWSFSLYVDETDYSEDRMIYAIFPYKKIETNLFTDEFFITISSENAIQDGDSSDEQEPISYSLELTEQMYTDSMSLSRTEYETFLFETMGPVLTILPISTVNITRDDFFVGTLIHLIKCLPNVHSLTLSTLSMVYPRYLSADEIQSLRSIANENKITRVELQWKKDLAQVQFILDLCPRIEQLEVDCVNDDSPETLIRFILMKNVEHIPHLSLLIFKMLPTQENLTNLLRKMIDLEQLRQNYTIQQIDNQIHLRWH